MMKRLIFVTRMVAVLCAICCWSCDGDLATPPVRLWPVRGVVEDGDGLPVVGATLRFWNDTDSSHAVCDSVGRFETSLPEGGYRLVANKAGYLQYADAIVIKAPGLELRVQLVLDPAQDYLPLAVGNWWEYDFKDSSGFVQTRIAWGIERWEIISLSKETGKITYIMRVEQKGKQNLNHLGFTDFTSMWNITITESNGKIVLMPFGTVLAHFMRPGEAITSPLVFCDTSKVTAGMPVLVDNREIETLAVVFNRGRCLSDRVGYAGTQLLIARQIGIVSQKTWERSLAGHSWSLEYLVLCRYFIQK